MEDKNTGAVEIIVGVGVLLWGADAVVWGSSRHDPIMMDRTLVVNDAARACLEDARITTMLLGISRLKAMGPLSI